MQDRYSGDVGDFSKLGLLRQIAATGLMVGVNWYLVADESHNNDGKHIGFLTDRKYDGCDDELRNLLRSVVEEERSVSLLEKKAPIPSAVYFSEALLPPATASFSRGAWHMRAMRRLCDCDIVFLDPDNGIMTKSTSPKSAKSIKFALRDEIIEYYTAGHSVVIYNHRCRETEPAYLSRFDWMREEPLLESAHTFGLKFKRGSIRDYIFAVQPQYFARVSAAENALMNSPWSRHFERLNLTR